MFDKGRGRRAQSVANDEVAQLLVPQIRFLRAAGVTLEPVMSILKSEFRRPDPKKKMGRLEHVSVEMVDHCGRVIAAWKTQPEFLSANGRPGDLLRRGINGFTELVKLSAPRIAPAEILRVLLRYGAVKKLRNGKLRLTSKLFNCTHPSGHVIAFEPSAAFLTDAAKVLEDHVETQSSRSRRPVRYWREVENAAVPQKFVDEFVAFSKRRVMVLMEEVEDWLDQHKVLDFRASRGKLVRLGIGIFAIAEKTPRVSSRNSARSTRALTGVSRASDLRS